jgi:hypothetical protein
LTVEPGMSRSSGGAPARGFRHEALLYAGDDDFVARATPLVRSALEAEEPVLVAIGSPRLQALRESLGDAGELVRWVDITRIGANPARIIPLWRAFVAGTRSDPSHPAPPLFGIGQPVYPERGAAAMVESHRHEALLNLAFASTPGFTLLCPYDTVGLDPAVIEDARRSHPHLRNGGDELPSREYPGLEAAGKLFDVPLPEAVGQPRELPFGQESLVAVHVFVIAWAGRLGLSGSQHDDLALAAVAVAEGFRPQGGTLGIWRESGAVIVDVAVRGLIDDPLAGREYPPPADGPKRGLWLANQVCDLVQARTTPSGSIVRLHMNLE